MTRGRWLLVIAACGVAIFALSFVTGWMVQNRELRGEGYRYVVIAVSAWRGAGLPVLAMLGELPELRDQQALALAIELSEQRLTPHHHGQHRLVVAQLEDANRLVGGDIPAGQTVDHGMGRCYPRQPGQSLGQAPKTVRFGGTLDAG